MDSAASFEEDNSDSDYMNVSSSSESSEENDFTTTKRKNLQINKRKDAPEIIKNPLSKLNIRQSTSQMSVKMCLKRKFSFSNSTTTTTKKENDGSASINSQLLSASQSPENQSLTPSLELEATSSASLSLLMPAPAGQQDDPPYFPEKFEGKVCAFCNLGERSQLGQGEMLRLEITEEEFKSSADASASVQGGSSSTDVDTKNGSEDLSKILRTISTSTILQQQLNRRQKGLNKCKNPVTTLEYVDELEKIGHHDAIDMSVLVENGFYYVHRSCAMWSFGVDRDPINDALSNVSLVLKQSLNRKCFYCNRYGASALCNATCQRAYHFPCIAASGSFQAFQSCKVFCTEHLGQVALSCAEADENINCRICGVLGDIGSSIACTLCGDHYHGACIGLAQQPGVRTGWQCKTCRYCQICRIPDVSDGRTLSCETCDKLYHAQCLRPVMATIPKYGWKCRCCRVCSDCGARTPGAGASSRWHNHYTVCDSCYQQRNKGYSCPICRKAYRAAAYREMVKCFVCQKFVHSTCDPEADLNAYERRKELNPDYEFTCGLCKTDRYMAMRRNNSGDDDSLTASQESLSNYDDTDMESIDGKLFKEEFALGLGKGKPFVASKIAKKRLGLSNSNPGQRPKGIGKLGSGFQKRVRTFELGRKRGPKSKMRGIFGVPGIGLQRPIAGDSLKQSDEEPGSENRLVLCSAKDRFVLTQDICVMCGAIGTDQEGCLISCAQCGQCYHPYCVSVKVTKEILLKGWRCLDCTVCEGCGDKNDEARLILCDDCDISYHIYCMEPPLSNVPQGTWKCKWCAICFKCGSNEPGNNCSWQNSYTECGPCASQSNCSVCAEIYSEGELIIQCTSCDRWLHCQCDAIKNESDAEKCAEEGYICLLCRPKDILPPHLQIKKKFTALSSQSSTKDESMEDNDSILSLALEGSHYVDGIYLSEHGLQFIKTLQTEPKRAKRRPKTNVEAEKDAGILAAIESVVSGSTDNSIEDIKMEPLDPNEEAQIYKDGMPWCNNEPAPEGFSLFTTETGQVILRKKRQRNLQKLGIGGFSVRNRAVRTTKNEDPEPSNSNSNNNNSDDMKKKKPNRRKQKNKLVETYPTYLQEAFFGKPLMDPNIKVKLESSSSDEDSKSNMSDDKTIKLSLDELKMIEVMRAKQQQKLQEEQKLLQLTAPKTQPISQPNLMSNGAQIQLNQKMQQSETNNFLSRQNSEPLNPSQTEIKTELLIMDDDENNSDTEALKDVLGLPGDLLDNDLVNTIMEDDDLTKNSAVLDDADVKGLIFDMEDDMLFKSVLTDESQESQESILTNSLTSYSTQSTPSHQPDTQMAHLNPPTTPVQANINQLQSPQSSSNPNNINTMLSNQLSNIQPQSPQIHTGQLNPINQHMILQQQQQQQSNQMHMQPTMIQRQNSLPSTSAIAQQQQRGYNFNEFPYRNQFTMQNTFPSQNQWNNPMDSDFGDLVPGSITPQAGQTPKVNNHQKTSERMAEDEKLGEMSTISAVLYANQNHPELKHEYPHWPDRYKQIMKKWRALSADKKAPYLQRARDNRSAQQAQLRTKKAQQVPELSPDNGTTSTNSTSPALSSTLSESSSLMDVTIMQQQQPPQQIPTSINPQQQQQQQQHIQVDQDKITAQQKSMKEAEQERQWKILQAQRAREQQQIMPPDHHRINDPNVQLQISTSLNDGSMSPVASPSPNSRNQFIAPPNKGRILVNPQSPSSFQHPGRPVSTQLQRQQRMNQSPFSPQSGTPQSPHDLFPGSPSAENFARPTEDQQFLHSPQTPKAVHGQSPVHTPNNANMSPVYSQPPPQQQQQQQPQNIRPLDNIGNYVQAPGTPRPSFNSGQIRTTVYARPDMFHNKPPFIQSPQSNQDQSNRQLRDLLQRTQAPPVPSPSNVPATPPFNIENDLMKNQAQNVQAANIIQSAQNNPGQVSDNTFRQPLPPPQMRQPRMQSMVGGQMIRSSSSIANPQRMIINPENRPRLGLRPGMVMNTQQMITPDQQHQQQLQQSQMEINQQRLGINTNSNNFNNIQQDMAAQRQHAMTLNPGQGVGMVQQQNTNPQHNLQNNPMPQPATNEPTISQAPGDAEGIPDSVTAELEKLEQDENAGMDGVGDILGGLGDDDDDLLDSLTAEMGADFNILEYADPELDTTDEKSTLLDSLEMDESENKEEKLKHLEAEKMAKSNMPQNSMLAQATAVNRVQIQLANPNIPQTSASIDPQNPNQNVQNIQQGAVPNQQIINQQQNFQRQVRFKANQIIPPNQLPEIQQIHQQMMLQLQQAAQNGKVIPPGTRLVANNNITGIVTGPNSIQLTVPTGQQRFQQVRVNPNMVQGNPNNPRMVLPHIQNRPNLMQGAQQQINTNMQGVVNQQQPSQQPPPPPYPEPPPPYPGQQSMSQNQEQPLLLEDLLEQEKREQARNIGTSQIDTNTPQNQHSIFSDQDYEKLRADVLTTTSQGISIPQQQQQPQQPMQQQQFAPRGMIQKQWRAQTSVSTPPITATSPDIVRSVPIFNANLQAAPPVPPDIITSENDRQIQMNYEAWLNQQNDSLQQQLRYYETEIVELRKLKKSLNTKQRQLKKSGSDLNEMEAQTLIKVTQEQAIVQKHLESARKQARNHMTTKQEYDNKQKAKQMANNPHIVQSPVGQISEQSPLMSPSPNVIQQSVQSPHVMAPSQSPLHSPSPMMNAQSPGPNSIMQSPGAHINNAMSPYNTMQQSPRIGTPHSQIEESPFSPNNQGQMESSGMSGNLSSPIPRMTSPQHRSSTPMQNQMMNRMNANPGQFNQQQNMQMGQQNRFIRPQMIPNDGNNRMPMRMPTFQQQMGHNPNVIRQVQYNTMDNNGNPQNIQTMVTNQNMDAQRALQLRQMQMRQQLIKQQQQQQQQQQNQGQMVQMSQMQQSVNQNPQMVMTNQPNQSPIHQQPQSPLINQNATSPMPRSPMIHYQQQQQQQNPNSPMMSQGIDSSPRSVYMQQNMQDMHGNGQNMMHPGGGGGGQNMMNPAPSELTDRFKNVKLGLRGGMPMWGNGNGNNNKKPPPTADFLQLIKKAQQQQQQQNQQAQSSAQKQHTDPSKVQGADIQQASTSKQIIVKTKSSLLKNPVTAKVKSLVDYDDNDSSNGTPPISPIIQKARQKILEPGKSASEEVVMVDSSPDEKQRVVDYDDDSDKMVTTEVSLNSTAQDIGDADTIIEASFDRNELVSSPLVTEPETTDYTLFESHVVQLEDSNDSIKDMINSDIIFEEPLRSEVKDLKEQTIFAGSSKEKRVGTHEDFEAMIDSGKDEDENDTESETITLTKCEQSDKERAEKSSEVLNIKRTIIPTSETETKREIKIPVVFPTSSVTSTVSLTLPANLMARANIQTTNINASVAGVSAHKKLVKTAPHPTAKVSIGNTTISVPVVLKNMPISTADSVQGTKKIITTNALNLSNLKKSHNLISVSGQKINTSAIVTLSLNKGNARPIQTVDFKQKLQQKPGSIILPASSYISSQPSQSILTSNAEIIASNPNMTILNKITSSSSSPMLTFTKIPTLTMTQDTSLPTKILEDDDIVQVNVDSLLDDKKFSEKKKESSPTTPTEGTSSDVLEKEPAVDTSKPKSLIPVHVIIKSRESSQSPIQKLTSGNMSQLSPLSQPIEINTNTHNATQQIRSIMSSLDSNEDAKNKSEADQYSLTTITQSNLPKTIIRSTSTPTSSSQSLTDTKVVSTQPSASISSASNIPVSQTNNILFVKQIKTLSSSIPSTIPTSSTIVVVTQSGQLQSQGSVIISNKPSNLLSMLSNQQQQQNSNSQPSTSKTTENKMEPPASTEVNKAIHIIKSNPTITNLLNSFKRSKSSDDVVGTKDSPDSGTSKRLSLEVANEIKIEPVETPVIKETSSASNNNNSNIPVTTVKSEIVSMATTMQLTSAPTTVNKIIPPPPPKPEDSQNVLLKQLLQNSGSGTSLGAPPISRNVGITTQRAPSLSKFCSLEAQLASPVIPPVPAKPITVATQSLITAIPVNTAPISTIAESLNTKIVTTTSTVSKSLPIHETSFISQPQPPPSVTPPVTNISVIGDKKPIVVLNRNDIPASVLGANVNKALTSPVPELSGMAPPNSNVKKELPSPGDLPKPSQSPTLMQPILMKSFSQTSSINSGNTTPVPLESPLIEVKKEMDDSSQSESISSDVSMIKTESALMTPTSRDGSMNDVFDVSPAKTAQELADELKKKKRREYQKNRRQMQLSNKEKGSKKPRKLQKNEEDYDSFIDNLMVQIKSLSQMQILEPLLPKNFNVCAIYGSHELNKVNSLKKYNTTSGELSGSFGKGELANISDFYNTKPFGSLNPKPEKAPVSTQRGFYDQEFPPIKFDDEDNLPNHHTQRSKYDILGKDRDIDTPDTIVNSSSPECVTIKHTSRFPGLRLIREEEDAEDEEEMTSFIDNRLSPSIPTIITPIPIRLKTGMSLTADKISLSDKENDPSKELGVKSCFEPPAATKDNNNNNVTVTLTLTSSAAEDIMGVLKSLANILNIPAPTAYQIVERTTTPPSQKLGLYRIKGKDGKEGQPVDIQTILNGTAKFCRHCDVVILNNAIKAKANEFPLLVNTELESDELYFCGSTCYKQFQWRPINMLDDKSLSSSTDDKALESISENISKIEMQTETESAKTDDQAQKESLKRKRKEMEAGDSTKEEALVNEKRQKLMRIKTFAANSFPQIHKQKKLSDREITEMLFRMNITVNSAPKILEDTRKCIFCHQIGDGVADGPSRLLNYDVDKWVHLNCALWSDGVYETVNGALMNLEAALQHSLNSQCTICNHLGATVKCFKARCGSIYHLNCAMKDNCVFYKNKTTMCNIHAPKSEKDNELTTLSVQRRVYIERDENRQVASIMHHSDMTNLMRVGSLILLNVGQLLPHQLQTFHTPHYIYPIGYKLIRFFWSMRHPNKRCRYICSIGDVAGRPEFRILVKEVNEEDLELRDESPKKVWQRILDAIAKLRREHQLVQIFPKYISGEDLFGLTEPAVVRILESLPGVETLHDYRFKYGRNPLLELPLAINPSGAARTEPRLKHNLPWKKPHTQRTGSSSQRPTFVPSTSAGEVACPYSKQFVHSKSSQYKKMKLEWRNNVFLARSKIQGLGLYAARDLEKHTMVIEYIGEVIRGELSELREKQYEARNRGIYMFRLDEDRVIDATLSGGLARYINHSCNPNCVTEIVEVDREYRIIIFAKRRINRGEELSYDYKFDIEDESRKIACNCGAAYCKKYMN